jgi:hypothetical protein
LSIETLEVSFRDHTQGAKTKAMSGGAAKAAPRQPEAHPRELKTQEGIEQWQG